MRLANVRSLRSRSGLSPAVSSSVLTVSGPTPPLARRAGGELFGDALEPDDGALDLGGVEERDAVRELAQGEAGDAGEAVVVGGDAKGPAGREQLASGQVTKPRAQLVGGDDQGGADLVMACVRAIVVCAAVHRLQGA